MEETECTCLGATTGSESSHKEPLKAVRTELQSQESERDVIHESSEHEQIPKETKAMNYPLLSELNDLHKLRKVLVGQGSPCATIQPLARTHSLYLSGFRRSANRMMPF